MQNSYLEIFWLALVQGLTEFLPVSSSGHLVLLPKLFGFHDPGLNLDAFLHLGTLAATVIYFRKDLLEIITNLIQKKSFQLPLGIILATIPAVVFGFSCKSFLASDLIRSLSSISLTLVLGSILLVAAEFISHRITKPKTSQELSLKSMFFIGCMQVLALLPGVSRSGSTIAGGVFMQLSKAEAARFSFLLGLPAIAGAGLLAIKDMLEVQSFNLAVEFWPLLFGFLISFVSGYLAIDFMLKYLAKSGLWIFIIYRLVLAGYLCLL